MSRFASPAGPLAVLAALVLMGPVAAQPAQPRVLLGGGVGQFAKPDATPEAAASDADKLKSAGLNPDDGAKLVGYLKVRTASDADRGKIDKLIRRFAADKFDDRLAAAAEVERLGPVAITPLREAEKDPDPEIAYRANKVRTKMEKVPHAEVAAAAVRAVVRLKPADATAALLGFLPLADTEALADEIRAALVTLAVRDGKADPALVAGLSDTSPVRRAAAYVALTEGGPAGQRVRIADAYPQLKAAVRKDTDPEAKFAGLWSLVTTTREKEFVPDLIATIPTLPRGRLWQLEELLLQLAGKHPEGGRFGAKEEALRRARDAWAAWWAEKGGGVDLAKLDFQPRLRGFTDLVLMDASGTGRGSTIATLGPDLKEKWRMPQSSFYPWDARPLPNGLFLMTEQTYNRVSERDAAGTAKKMKNMIQPVAAEPLADDGRLYVCRANVTACDKDGNTVWLYARPMNAHDVVTGRRAANGDTLLLANTQQGVACVRLDGKGKEVGKPVSLSPQPTHYMAGMDVVDNDTILVCENNQVAEYDLKTGKAKWTYPIAQASAVQRLPNGNTLITSFGQNRAVEVDPSREVLWEYRGKDGANVCRAYRR